MIRIIFDPAALTNPTDKAWWEAWSGRAEAATGDVVRAFEAWLGKEQPRPPFEFKFNTQIWKDLKDWLLEHVFHQKCAYCERQISGYYGDAEHYRPKGAGTCLPGPAPRLLSDLEHCRRASRFREFSSGTLEGSGWRCQK